MKGLVSYPRVDTSQNRSEYLDERYFRLLARRFRRANPHINIHLDAFDEDDSAEFLSDIEKPAYQGLDIFVYIGHGGQHRLYSADRGSQDIAASDIANRLRAACNDGAVIIFYACNVGRLNDSLLRDIHVLTIDKNFRLYGHSTSGRAGNNPNKTVFPPTNGAMLIDVCLGNLAHAPRFRRAWNYSMGNESDDLWASFFSLSNNGLLRRACRPVIRRAVTRNRTFKRTLGWQSKLDKINALLGLANGDEEKLAIGVALWQYQKLGGSPGVDGIIGPNTWRQMKSEI
jgi:hypothetical protein